jgi:hypothetical protein
MVLVSMTFACGDSQEERLELARAPEVLAHRWITNGLIVLGCDGSRFVPTRNPQKSASNPVAGPEGCPNAIAFSATAR